MREADAVGEGQKGKLIGQGPQGKAGRGWAFIAAGVVAMLIMAALLGVLASRDKIWPPATGPRAPAVLGEYNTTTMSIPASTVSTTARFYEYNTSGATVRFFVVKDGNGTIRTAFDECPMCYGKHLGFRQEGSSMVENCCNMSFPISSIGPGGKGCHPEYLPSAIEGGRVMIAKTSLMAGAYLFRTGTEPAAIEEVNMTTIAIPLSSVSTTATWYQYDISGATVRLFAVKDSVGGVRTAFDECPMCYGSHLGFRQEGTSMVENCCDMAFPIDKLTAEGCNVSGCHPVFLPSRVEGDRVMISKSSLAAGSYLFRSESEVASVEDHNLTTVSIPLSSVSGTATWYEYGVSGAPVRFFAVKDASGTVHTALDTCPKCYRKHAGFRQDGTSMVENCCNMPFAIDNITAEGCNLTGCHPVFLPSHIEGDNVMISKSSLASGSSMFRIVNETAGVERVDAGTIAVPLSSVSGTASWYGCEVNGTTVRFFMVKDVNGTVHAALDTCPKCYKKHAGFRQDGTSMVENCCNMPFPIANITAEGCGGMMCHPVFLPSHIDGNRLMMAVADLETGSYMFK